jgi:thiaminase
VLALLALVDSMVEGLPQARRERLTEIFLTSEYYETVAWSAYYDMEEWVSPAVGQS